MKRIVSPLILALAVTILCSSSHVQALAESENGAVAEKEVDKPAADEADKPEADEKDEKASEETTESKGDRKTFEVEAKPLKIEESLDGMFVAEKAEEISLTPEEWSTFKIEEVVAHGTKVKEGETLIKFEDKDLLEAIADLDLELHLSEQRIRKAEQELPQKERGLKRQLANAEIALSRSEEDYQRYKETERKRSIDMANMWLKTSKFMLDYYRDELEQLEKMYEADELTEETEEIILRRQRFMVERAEFEYDNSKYNHEKTLEVAIPRRDRDIEESLESTKALLERAQTASQIDSNVDRYELEKQKRQRSKSQEKHVNLLADKSLLTLRSPMAGIAYYGSSTDGKWNRIAEMRGKLLPGKNADRGAVLMTIVDPAALHLLTMLDEKLLISLIEGQEVKVELTVEGAETLKGKVASISTVPISEGKFESKIEFTGELPEWLVPGMRGKATAVTYQKDDALLVPASAVHKDESKDEEYVWLVQDDEVKKTVVKTGRKKGDQVEVTEGLSAGDTISLDDEEKQDE